MVALPDGFTLTEGFLAPDEADALLAALPDAVAWGQPSVRLFGRTIPVPRQVAWCGRFAYAYSGIVHPAAAMPPMLAALSQRISAATGHPYNGVLLNRYRSGQDSMGWHADDDYDAGAHSGVASVSLGGARRFLLRTRDGQRAAATLTHGSLLFMAPGTQRRWQHAIPKTKRPVETRINLTFRYMLRANVSAGSA